MGLIGWLCLSPGAGFTYEPSPLALQLSATSALRLKQKYLDQTSKKAKTKIPDWLTKLVGKSPPHGPKEIIQRELQRREPAAAAAGGGAGGAEPTYLTLVIDEAHLIRNEYALWSLLAIAMGSESQRVIPMTGTYSNQSLQHQRSLNTGH